MRKNKLKELLATDQPTIGTRVHSSWPSIVEAIGHSGMFDYVEFVAEYAPYDLFGLDNFCRAAELYDLGAMIKVDFEGKAHLAQKAVGSGFQSVLFADCRTPDDVQSCVQAVRPDTPDANGRYGVAMRRFSYMSYGGGPTYVQALKDVVVAVMIEKETAVNNLDEILTIEGIDMIQWGPADYSMSIGMAGKSGHSDIRKVEQQVFETCLKAGIPPRAEIENLDQAKYYLDMGVRHFSLSTDINILFNWLKQNGEALRQEFEG